MPLLTMLTPLFATAALAAAPTAAALDAVPSAPRVAPPPVVDPRSGETRPPVRYRPWSMSLSHLWYHPDEDAPPLVRRGQRIYGRVLVRVIGSCTFTAHMPRPTHREPTVLLQLAVPVLNRAPAPADRPLPEMREQIHGLYLRWTRRITTPDGRQLMVAATIDRQQETLPTRCMRRIHARLRRALEGEPAIVRRAALRSHRARRSRYPPRLGPPVETVSLLNLDVSEDEFETIAHAELPRLLRGDAFGTVPAADPSRALVGGIAPDEVESVTLTLGRQEWDRRAQPPAPPPLRLTLPVHDNVVAAEVDRPYADATVLKTVLHRTGTESHPEIRVIR